MEFRIEQSAALTEEETSRVLALVEACRAHEGLTLSFPFEEPDTSFFLLSLNSDTPSEERLAAVLAVCAIDDAGYELLPFTHPAFRRQGFFDALFDEALQYLPEDAELLCPADEHCLDGLSVLAAMEADCVSEELNRSLSAEQFLHSPAAAESGCEAEDATIIRGLRTVKKEDPDGILHISVFDAAETPADENAPLPLLSLSLLPEANDTVYLFSVEVPEERRGTGIAKRCFPMVLRDLFEHGTGQVLLQVSADNAAAQRLYTYCGFQTDLTLRYFAL